MALVLAVGTVGPRRGMPPQTGNRDAADRRANGGQEELAARLRRQGHKPGEAIDPRSLHDALPFCFVATADAIASHSAGNTPPLLERIMDPARVGHPYLVRVSPRMFRAENLSVMAAGTWLAEAAEGLRYPIAGFLRSRTAYGVPPDGGNVR